LFVTDRDGRSFDSSEGSENVTDEPRTDTERLRRYILCTAVFAVLAIWLRHHAGIILVVTGVLSVVSIAIAFYRGAKAWALAAFLILIAGGALDLTLKLTGN
jgi:hypothetical protein